MFHLFFLKHITTSTLTLLSTYISWKNILCFIDWFAWKDTRFQRSKEKKKIMLQKERFLVAAKKVALILFVLCITMASSGESTRMMKGRVMETLLKNRLPRGPVPPSGPSRCHNKLDPFNERKFYYLPRNDITCP